MNLFTKRCVVVAICLHLSFYLNAQVITPINNPDNGKGFRGRAIVYKNNLYFQYQNVSGKYLLAKYDGSAVSLIDNPDAGEIWMDGYNRGFAPLIYHDDLYFQYTNASGVGQLAMYDGVSISLLPNPDATGTMYPQFLTVFNDKLLFPYNNSGISQIAQYDGSTTMLIPNPAGTSVGQFNFDEPIIYNNAVYMAGSYTNHAYNVQLAKYDGNNVTIIPNPVINDPGYQGNPVVYNNKLYFIYYSNNQINNGYMVADYDGTSINLLPKSNDPYTSFGNIFTYNTKLYSFYNNGTASVSQLAEIDDPVINLISNPNPTNNSGAGGDEISYNNSLFFAFSNYPYQEQLAKYDGNAISLITNPDNGSGINDFSVPLDDVSGYPIVYASNLYFRYLNASNQNQLAKSDGTTVSLIPNVTGAGSYEGDPIEYNGNLYFAYLADTLTGNVQLATLGAGTTPLKLLSFTTQKQNSNVLLQWQTANEVNTKSFIIEQSTDGIHFTDIATVSAKGFGNNNYNYSAVAPDASVVYYRLKMIDKNGDFSYSIIVSVKTQKDIAASIEVFPNPTNSWVNIKTDNTSLINTTARVINSVGVAVKNILLTQGVQKVDVNNLPAGLYFIQTQFDSKKIIISR